MAEKRVPGLRGEMSLSEDQATARGLFRFVMEGVLNDRPSEDIERALELAEKLQDLDETSATYGNFRWYPKNPKPVDKNAVEFCMETATQIWMHHRDALTDAARERLERMMRLSVEGILRHHPAISYTNITLMRIWNCVAIGELLDTPDLADEGYAKLDEWLDYTRENGIHEYLSPTYYPVSMFPLELVAKYAAREDGRRKANRGLRLFWTQIAANWFGPCRRLGGPHGRDYDYQSTGFRGARLMEKVEGALGDGDGPDRDVRETMRELVNMIPRTVTQRFGDAPGEVAVTYMGKAFCIGSAGASYGPIDKCLTANVGNAETPMVNFCTDARGDAYGNRKFELADGHSKALHLVPFVTSVQNGSEVLLMAAPAPEGRHYHRSAPNPTCLLSHLTIPDVGELWVGDGRITETGAFERDVASRPVFLRLDDVVVGARVVLGWDTQRGQAPVQLVRDEAGQDVQSVRLTCRHTDQPADDRGVIALWVQAAEGLDEDGFAAFRQTMQNEVDVAVDGDQVDVRVGSLRLCADVVKEERIAVEGGHSEAKDALLMVNGRELGRGILG